VAAVNPWADEALLPVVPEDVAARRRAKRLEQTRAHPPGWRSSIQVCVPTTGGTVKRPTNVASFARGRAEVWGRLNAVVPE
jgi:hypothetical protein